MLINYLDSPKRVVYNRAKSVGSPPRMDLFTEECAMAEEMKQPAQEDKPQPTTLLARVRGVLHGPVLIGVIAALIAIGLSVFGMIRNPDATPLNVR